MSYDKPSTLEWATGHGSKYSTLPCQWLHNVQFLPFKVICNCYLFFSFFHETPIFDYCVVRWGPKNKLSRVQKRFNHVFKFSLHSQLWTQLGEPQYSVRKSTKRAILITITKLREVWCLMMFHGRFVDAPWVLLCKCNW